jgi:hypothetical protein
MGKTYLKSKKRTQKIKKKRRTNVKMKRKYIRSKRKKGKIRKKRNITKKKIMRGGMEQDLTGSARVPPEGPCKKQKPTLRTWPDRYLKISGNSLLVFNKEGDTMQRGSSILDLTDCEITKHIESFTLRDNLYAIKIKRDRGLEKPDVTEAKFAFPTLELRGKFFDALTNISAGREWNVSEKQERIIKLQEEERIIKLQEEERLRIEKEESYKEIMRKWNEGEGERIKEEEEMKSKIDIKQIIDILNKYSRDFTVNDIFSFSNGVSGVAISVNAIDSNGVSHKLVIKIIYDEPELVLEEFKIQQKVNGIDEDISPLAYHMQELDPPKTEGGALPSILERLHRSKKHISTQDGTIILPPEIPWSWLRSTPTGSTKKFTIVFMEHVDGINWSRAKISKNVLEDLRLKIIALHSGGIYHCDLHPDNILVHNNAVKIIDFGFAVESTNNDWEEATTCLSGGKKGHVLRDEPQNQINEECGVEHNGTESCID